MGALTADSWVLALKRLPLGFLICTPLSFKPVNTLTDHYI